MQASSCHPRHCFNCCVITCLKLLCLFAYSLKPLSSSSRLSKWVKQCYVRTFAYGKRPCTYFSCWVLNTIWIVSTRIEPWRDSLCCKNECFEASVMNFNAVLSNASGGWVLNLHIIYIHTYIHTNFINPSLMRLFRVKKIHILKPINTYYKYTMNIIKVN